MSDWTEERINRQRDLAVAGRAGFWILLQGGPRNGSRGFVPHLDWPYFVLIDAEGAVWSFAHPSGELPIPLGGRLVGTYVLDREQEVMIWRAADGAPIEIPSMR